MEDDAIIGTDGDDDLRGTSGADLIRGLAGNDILRGLEGRDTLEGGEGDDTLLGGMGDDRLRGRRGDDAIEGGEGDDDLQGNSGDDILSGGGGNDVLIAGSGDDVLVGGPGDDLLQGGMGRDRLDGGAGEDTADYSDIRFGVDIQASAGGGLVADGISTDFVGGGELLSGIETVLSSRESDGGVGFSLLDFSNNPEAVSLPIDVDLVAERVTFRTPDPDEPDITLRIVGFGTVIGSPFDDTVVGDDEDGFFLGSQGNDTYMGGGGFDVLAYLGDITDLGEGATSTLGLGVNTLTIDGEFAGRQTLAAFDVEAGTVDIIDFVGGDDERAAQNTIDARDSLAPGDVSVRIELPNSDDTINPFIGEVTATFVEDVGGFAAGDTFGFEITDFTNAIGTAFDDVLIGSVDANTLKGGRGDDVLRGREGDDRLDGKRGDDDLRGGDGADRLDGRRGDDNLLGGDGDDRLFGQRGDDVIRGGQGADELGGGSGADTFRWTQADIAADAGQVVDIVQDFEAEDFLLLAGREVSAREAFELARAEASLAGVEFGINIFGDQIVLRADGGDDGSEIEASEVFARLRIDADDFAIA